MDSELRESRLVRSFTCHRPMPFPEQSFSDAEVLAEVRDFLDRNPYEIENNFGQSYVGPPHPITRQVSVPTSSRSKPRE